MMDTTIVAGYALATGGNLAAAISVRSLVAMQISARAANAALTKLARADNLDRLIKLCHAAPGSYLDAVQAGARAGRDGGATDEAQVEVAVLEAYDARGATLAQRWRRLTERGLMGGLVAGAGVALAVTSGPFTSAIGVLAGLAALLGLYLVARGGALDVALAGCRADVMPAVVQAAVRAMPGARAPTPTPSPSTPAREPSTPAPPARAFDADAARPPTERASARTLRDGACPLCAHTTVRTLTRDDARFTTYVCAACGFTQEFADLTRLAP